MECGGEIEVMVEMYDVIDVEREGLKTKGEAMRYLGGNEMDQGDHNVCVCVRARAGWGWWVMEGCEDGACEDSREGGDVVKAFGECLEGANLSGGEAMK